ncbi:FG-GAP-like repeat-containing protein [Reichenbachiella sp.]|uniref:FG-GAP-like repeat-containing protein n=1 Tax=Reichenbachiella sp. TaxID=2184521 RepID=UPI003BB12F4C
MKYILYLFIALFLSSEGLCQERAIHHELEENMSGESRHYIARESIKLKNGFSYKSDATQQFNGQLRNFELKALYESTLTNSQGGSNNNGVAGTTPGSFNVGSTGGAAYNIPILVSPGTADMEPNLSISYNSQAKNGIMGYGFTLSGLSSISRAPTKQYLDNNVKDPVDFDGTDKLAIDGERLILVSGTYGAAGSEYRTENNRFAKVVAYESQGSSGFPKKFKVWEKSGLIKYYGYTADSQIGEDDIGYHSWLLNRVEDRKGNFISVEYTKSYQSYFPKKINYTGNDLTGMEPYASVEFEYQGRADDPFYYVGGHRQQITELMSTIKCRYGATIFREYALSYDTYDNVPHLASVTEKNGAGEAYNPIKFDWNNLTNDLQVSSDRSLQMAEFSTNLDLEVKQFSGDFTGNGIADVLVISPDEYVDLNTQVHKWRLFEYQKNELVSIAEGNVSGPEHDFYVGDFNADGLTDFIEIDTTGEYRSYKIFEATGSSFTPTPSADLRIPHTESKHDWMYVSDFDGDGYADLMYNTLSQPEGQAPAWLALVFFNNNTIFPQNFNDQIEFRPDFVNTKLHGNELQLGDYNGDGMTDIYVGLKLNSTMYDNFNKPLVGNESCIYFSTGSRIRGQAFRFSQSENLPEINNDNIAGNVHQGDFNGDGKADFLVRHAYATQTGETVTGSCTPCTGGGPPPLDCDDCPDGSTCNQDGECVEPIYQYNWHIYYGTGLGFEMDEVNVISGLDDYHVSPVDVDGDGRTELSFFPTSSSGTVKIYRFNNASWSQIESFSKSDESKLVTGDFTGNGTTDFLEFKKGVLVSHGAGAQVDRPYRFLTDFKKEKSLVKSIVNSRGAMMLIDYLPMTNSDIHVLDRSLTNASVIGAQFPVFLVSGVYADDGLGGLSKTTYQYEGGAIHRKGNGFLGFQKVTTKNITSQTKTEQYYSYDKHGLYVPQLDKQVVSSINNGNKLSVQEITYQNLDDGHAKTYVLAQDQVIVEKYDSGSGSLTSRLTTKYDTYDAYGNITKMTQTYSSGHTVVTDNEYQTANTSEWLISRLKSASVTKTAPGETPSTRSSSFTYDGLGFLKTETIEPSHPLSLSTTYTYDAFGNVITSTVTGVGGTRVDQSQYDTHGRLLMNVTNAIGHSSSFSYHQVSGTMLSSTDANGLVTTQEYDNFYRLIKVIDPLGNTAETTYSWDVSGGPSGSRYSITVTTSDGGEQKTFYDRLGRELRSQAKSFDGQFIQVDQIYNRKGQVEKKSDPYFVGASQYWHYPTYDDFGRVTKTESPGDRVTKNEYAAYSSITTNAKQQNNSATVDAFDQLVTSTNHEGKALTYAYYSSGLLHTATDSKGNTTTLEYDLLGNKTKVIDPDLGVITYDSYDAFGQLLKQTDAEGAVTEFTYDNLGRPLTRTITKAGVVESTNWVYDTQWKGALTSVVQSNGITKSYVYDSNGQVIEETEQIEGQAYSTYYSYLSDGKLDVLTYPSGFEVKHIYNAQGFLSSVKDPSGPTTYWQATYQNARGQYESYVLGNGAAVSHGFNPKTGQLNSIQVSYNQTLLQDMSFAFDLLSNLTSRSDHLADGGLGLTETFNYDNLNRLIKSEITGKSYGALDMSYDELGNLTYKSDVGYYHYDGTKPHAVSSVDNIGGSIPSTVQNITYTGFNKVSLITEGFSALEFIYGSGHERKVTKTFIDGSLTTTKVFVGGIYEKEINEEGEDRELHYIKGGSGTVAIHTIVGPNSETHYLLKDHLGSVAGIMDASATVLERYSYDAWGQRRDADTWDVLAGSVDQEYDRGYTGHEHLHLFSLINMNGRVYDPVLGRFLSADPFTQFPDNLQSYNRYSYVLNNPLSLTDPSGYLSWGSAIGTVLNIATTIFLTPIIGYQLAAGAGAFIGTFAGSLIDGASLGDALFAATVSGIYGVAGATLAHGIGTAFDNAARQGFGNELARAASHATAQGFMSFSRGGNFWHGFSSGGISSLAASASSSMDSFGAELAISSTAGGASATIAGGNFADGAVTGAYVLMFNHYGERWQENRSRKRFIKSMVETAGTSLETAEALYAIFRYLKPAAVFGGFDVDWFSGPGADLGFGMVRIVNGNSEGEFNWYLDFGGGMFGIDGSLAIEGGLIYYTGDMDNFNMGSLESLRKEFSVAATYKLIDIGVSIAVSEPDFDGGRTIAISGSGGVGFPFKGIPFNFNYNEGRTEILLK